MKLYYCSFLFQDAGEDVKKSKHPNSISGHRFSSNLIRGLTANGVDTTVINIPRVRRFPDYPKIFFRKTEFLFDGVTPGVHLGFINFLGLNQLTQTLASYRCLKKLLKHRDPREQTILMAFNTTLPHARAMLAIKKRYPDVILCTAIGDIHGSFGIRPMQKGLLGKLSTRLDEQIDDCSRQFDCFAFLTQHMAGALGVEDKPSTVLEGMYLDTPLPEALPSAEKTVFYAGALREEYGIPHLLRAFCMIEDPDYRLILAGGGDGADTVRQYAKKDPRIQYLGFITPQEVAQYQQRATALISPRVAGDYEFVKYSFPSKTMECLASGKPFIAHRLPCDPPEYGSYIQYAADESDQALRDQILAVCELSAEDRKEIGRKAREFIVNEKNPKAMTKRILELWQEMEKENEA